MNPIRFDEQLAARLLNDVQASYPRSIRIAARLAAIREYSRIRPLRKRFGTGHLVQDAESGQNILYATGGPFSQGDTLTLEKYTPNADPIVVQSVSRAAPAEEQLSYLLQIQTQAPLAKTHLAGSAVFASTLGLTSVSGQETYWLPYDWFAAETDTFEIAFGQKPGETNTSSFYEGAQYTDLLSGATPGESSNWLGGYGLQYGYPPGLVTDQNGRPLAVVTPPTCQVYDGTPKSLVLSPAPAQVQTYVFDYYGMHVAQTVPDEAFEGLIAYAAGQCYLGRAGMLAGLLTYKNDDMAQEPHLTAKAAQEAYRAAMDEFDIKIRKRPVMMLG